MWAHSDVRESLVLLTCMSSVSCACVILGASPRRPPGVPQSIVGDVVTEHDKRVHEDDFTIQRDPHAVDYSRHALFPRNHPANVDT